MLTKVLASIFCCKSCSYLLQKIVICLNLDAFNYNIIKTETVVVFKVGPGWQLTKIQNFSIAHFQKKKISKTFPGPGIFFFDFHDFPGLSKTCTNPVICIFCIFL